MNLRKYYIGAAVPNVATDLAMLIMPLPYVWDLKISMKRKIGVCLFFFFGGL